jgi:uncharacterized protein (DUF4415 family)
MEPVSRSFAHGVRDAGFHKELISIRLDQEVIAAFRATGESR